VPEYQPSGREIDRAIADEAPVLRLVAAEAA
jgi:hypothetical protein